MSDRSRVVSRVVRWGAVLAVICVAVGLYFRLGTRVLPLTTTGRPAATTDATH